MPIVNGRKKWFTKYRNEYVSYNRNKHLITISSPFCSLGGLDEPGAVSPVGAAAGGALPAEVDAADGRRRRPRHGPRTPLRLLRQALPPNIPQVRAASQFHIKCPKDIQLHS